jgi:glyoxylase-like metal-dependent hydrolase (beta-lactamase superfamily II)/ferredoxin
VPSPLGGPRRLLPRQTRYAVGMADPKRAVPGSAPGAWFVDDSCMNCDASRQCAPTIFGERNGQSVVLRQPTTPDEITQATRALLSCPTSSIGAANFKPDLSVFPHEFDAGVFLAGFNSPDAYGGNSWLVRRPTGNLLIDGPRYTGRLVKQLHAWGGLADILLTHRDDLGEAQRYAHEFNARVWIHRADARAAPIATDHFDGEAPTQLRADLQVLPVPGHTRGSVMFLLDDRFLFTGDPLFWSRGVDALHAHRQQCWYSWPAQTASLATLRGLRFEWVLPGHGGWAHRPPEQMQASLTALVQRMEQPGWRDAW